MAEHLIPIDLNAPVTRKPEPAAIDGIRKTPTRRQIDAAARALGLKALKVKELSHRAVIGQLVQSVGAAKVGSYMLLASEPMITDTIKQVDKMIDEYSFDPKASASLAAVKAKLIELWVKTAEAHIKTENDRPPEVPHQTPQVPAFPAGAAVQINLNAPGVDTKVIQG